LAAQVLSLNKTTPCGLKNYCERARDLLKASAEGFNPFEKYKPEVPTGVTLNPGSEDFDHYEFQGLEELSKTGFVLIAGGLGERLGYSGIKIDLPVTVVYPDYSYIYFYSRYVHACRERAL
jgi:UDP-sugar pyrophosphorylase